MNHNLNSFEWTGIIQILRQSFYNVVVVSEEIVQYSPTILQNTVFWNVLLSLVVGEALQERQLIRYPKVPRFDQFAIESPQPPCSHICKGNVLEVTFLWYFQNWCSPLRPIWHANFSYDWLQQLVASLIHSVQACCCCYLCRKIGNFISC